MRLEYPPIKAVTSHKSRSYADIVAHTNEVFRSVKLSGRSKDKDNLQARHFCLSYGYAPDPTQELYGAHDICTSAHETIHQINSEIANGGGRHRDKNVGLYCLENLAFVLDEPTPLTIQQVAGKIPQAFRKGVLGLYDLYCVQQARSWGDRPFYLFDEWVAYTNGSIVALEMSEAGAYNEKRWDSIHGAVYFTMFSLVTVSMIEVSDEVRDFVTFQLSRVKELVEVTQDVPNLARQENVDDLAKILDSEFAKPFNTPNTLDGYGTGEYL